MKQRNRKRQARDHITALDGLQGALRDDIRCRNPVSDKDEPYIKRLESIKELIDVEKDTLMKHLKGPFKDSQDGSRASIEDPLLSKIEMKLGPAVRWNVERQREMQQERESLQHDVNIETEHLEKLIATGRREVQAGRLITQEFFGNGTAALEKVKDYAQEALGISAATCTVLLVMIICALGLAFAFVYIAATAFLGDDTHAAVESLLVGISGAVAAVSTIQWQQSNSEEDQRNAGSTVNDIVTSQVKAVVGKMMTVQDEELLRFADDLKRIAASDGSGLSNPDLIDLSSDLRQEDPLRHVNIITQCQTEEDKAVELRVVKVYADDDGTDPVLNKLKSLEADLNRIKEIQGPIRYDWDLDLLS